ncbi:hypothetical protein ACOXXX_14270 [Thalassococcus sp. BH17M4-6]|uniref:hypothetical protein n=1 Tax=Thalassococcus sp. BH17M4-6 TaxID=3413148 RepID=UPI003BC62121
MRRASVTTALAVLLATQAPAAIVRDCNRFEARADNLMMPPAESIRTFANGDIRLMWLDTTEPACCSSHLMVTLPSPEDPGLICALVSRDDALGFGGLDLPGAVASYDPARGLQVKVPANLWTGDAIAPLDLTVTINQQTGVVRASESPLR